MCNVRIPWTSNDCNSSLLQKTTRARAERRQRQTVPMNGLFPFSFPASKFQLFNKMFCMEKQMGTAWDSKSESKRMRKIPQHIYRTVFPPCIWLFFCLSIQAINKESKIQMNNTFSGLISQVTFLHWWFLILHFICAFLLTDMLVTTVNL